MDLTPPLNGPFSCANIAVPMNRPRGLDDVDAHPLLLWSDEAGWVACSRLKRRPMFRTGSRTTPAC